MNKLITIIFLPLILFFSTEAVSRDLRHLPANTVIVIGDMVNIRSQPRITSKVIGQLRIAQVIRIIKRTKKIDKIGNLQGEWYYIDSGLLKRDTSKTIVGWVFSYYLSDLKKFKRVKRFQTCSIEDSSGDWLLSYMFLKDGTYIRKYLDRDSAGNMKMLKTTGEIYQYQKIIAAYDRDGSLEFFYINNNGVLCSKYYNSYGKKICAKCK